MDKREARQYVYSNPPADPTFQERRPSLIGRFFGNRSRTSSLSEDNMGMGMQRRGSIDPPDVTAASITQKVQQAQKKTGPNPNEIINIFT